MQNFNLIINLILILFALIAAIVLLEIRFPLNKKQGLEDGEIGAVTPAEE